MNSGWTRLALNHRNGIVLGAFLATAVWIPALVIGSQWRAPSGWQASRPPQAQTQENQSAPQARRDATEPSNPRDGPSRQPRPAERGSEESKASTEWWMMVFTGLAALVAAIQAALFLRQLRFMRGGVNDTRMAAVAAQAAADAGRQQAETARQAFVADQRPWVALKGVSMAEPVVRNENGLRLAVKFVLKNTGKTPALNVWVYTRVILVPEINPAEAQRKLIAEIPDQLTGGRLGLALFPDDTTEEEKVTTIHYREYVDFLDGHIARVLPVIVG